MPGSGASAVEDPRRILVRGVNWLGDAVMTLPALQRLHERFPEAQFSMLSHQKLAELWQASSWIDSVITFATGESTFAVGRRLRPEGFDLALVLPNSPRSAIEVWWARIAQRVGYAGGWRSWLLTRAVRRRAGNVAMRKRSAREIKRLVRAAETRQTQPATVGDFAPEAHQLHEYLFLTAALGANPLPVAPRLELRQSEIDNGRRRVLAGLDESGSNPLSQPRVLLGANPSAAYGPAKRWPAERFAAAMRGVSKAVEGAVWVLLGPGDDEGLCGEIAARANVPAVNLAGRTTLRELMGVLAACRVLLTNDSGPMHLAAALGTPVVAVFGSTSPELTGPGLPGDSGHRVLSCGAPCSPCFRRTCPIDSRCLTGISAEQAVNALIEIIKKS